MGEITFTENLRCIHHDLESIYDLAASIDQMRFFISTHTKFRLQNDDVHLFVNLAHHEFTAACPVVGVPEDDAFEGQDKFYLEDYERLKVYRVPVHFDSFEHFNEVNLLDQVGDLSAQIFEKDNDGENKPSVVRILFENWDKCREKDGEFGPKVDFFLD